MALAELAGADRASDHSSPQVDELRATDAQDELCLPCRARRDTLCNNARGIFFNAASGMKSTVERALELAKAGRCQSVTDIRKQLSHENWPAVDQHLSGSALKAQLRRLMAEVAALSRDPARYGEVLHATVSAGPFLGKQVEVRRSESIVELTLGETTVSDRYRLEELPPGTDRWFLTPLSS